MGRVGVIQFLEAGEHHLVHFPEVDESTLVLLHRDVAVLNLGSQRAQLLLYLKHELGHAFFLIELLLVDVIINLPLQVLTELLQKCDAEHTCVKVQESSEVLALLAHLLQIFSLLGLHQWIFELKNNFFFLILGLC